MKSGWGTPRERALAAIGLVLLAGVGISFVRDAVYLPKKKEIFRETRRSERKLRELEYLRVRSEEIRERFEALDRDSQEPAEGSPVTAEDLLQRLEAMAKGNVHLVKVHPEPVEGVGAAQTRLSLEFLDERRGLDPFLRGLVQELGGDVHAFQASVSGRGELRCQATVVFSHDSRSSGADVGEDAGGGT